MQGGVNICKSINVLRDIGRMKDNGHMIIIDTEKALGKIQHPFMITTLNNLGIEEPYLNIKRAYMTSPQLTSYLTVKG